MRKPRKLTPLGRAKKSIREYVQQIVSFTGQVATLKLEVANLRTQLDEARRRTVPCLGAVGGEINFLPLAIETVEMKSDVVHIESFSGLRHALATSCRAVIVCRGDIVHTQYTGRK